VLRAVTAAKPTAGASANLIMPMERAYDFDASTQSPSPTRGRISRHCSTNSGSGRWPRSMTRPHAGDLRVDAEDGCAVDDWDAIAQGTPGLACTVSHGAILSSLAMDPPRCSGPR
jgi:hypothetical protein